MACIDCDVSECIHNDGNHGCDREYVDLQFVMYKWNEPLMTCANYEPKDKDD